MRKLILTLGATALLAAPAAASAADYTVTGGRLDWTMANLYDATPDPARTWLGYATYTVGGGAANGSISPIAPATLTGPTGATVDVVNTTAARGASELYKLTYPAATTGSTFSATGAGRIKASIELTGAFKFQIHETRGNVKQLSALVRSLAAGCRR